MTRHRGPPSHLTTQGYTLIELLIAVGLLALLMSTVAVVVSRTMQASRSSALAAAINVSIVRLSQQLGNEIDAGDSILLRASTRRLDLLKLGQGIPLSKPPGVTWMGKTTVTFQGQPMADLVGKPIVVTGSQGDYLLTRVISSTSNGNNSTVVLSCNLSLPATLTAYPYRTLSLDLNHNYTRIENGNAVVVGENVDHGSFLPVYGLRHASPYPLDGRTPPGMLGKDNLDTINFALVSTGENPRTMIGSVGIHLPGIKPVDCMANPKAPPNNLGKLQVNVMYNDEIVPPPGVRPNVGINGPEALTSITKFVYKVFEYVTPGAYSVDAPSIPAPDGERVYDAHVRNSPATVGNGLQDTINVNYQIRKGKVTVQVAGLPDPVPANGVVSFIGPETVTTPAQNGQKQVLLTPGDYTVNADPIGEYEAEISTPNLHVTSYSDTSLVVNYGIPKGAINVQIVGLPTPPPATGYVHVTGPDARDVTAQTGTAVLTLKRGTYSISADPIGQYQPSVSSSTVNVGKGSSTTVTISYALPKGPLSVTVQGLPAGTVAPISVSGPENQTLGVQTGTSSTASLIIGTYTVTAPPMTVAGKTYNPTPENATVTLNNSGANHVINYSMEVPPPLSETGPTEPPNSVPGPFNPSPPPPGSEAGKVNLLMHNVSSDPEAEFNIYIYDMQGDNLVNVGKFKMEGNKKYEVDSKYFYSPYFFTKHNEIEGECDQGVPGCTKSKSSYSDTYAEGSSDIAFKSDYTISYSGAKIYHLGGGVTSEFWMSVCTAISREKGGAIRSKTCRNLS